MKKSKVDIHFKAETKLSDLETGSYYKFGGDLYLVGFIDGEKFPLGRYAVRLRDGRMFRCYNDLDHNVEMVDVEIYEE